MTILFDAGRDRPTDLIDAEIQRLDEDAAAAAPPSDEEQWAMLLEAAAKMGLATE